MQKEEIRKVTVVLPKDLVERAIKASGVGLTPTIKKGLEAIAASNAYEGLRRLRGKVHYPPNFVKELRGK
jgi:hypothetical protein